jgi:1-acyl-sn-glycerol-3-phosphate acyltransferase
VLGVLVFPLALLVPDSIRKTALIQRTIHYAFRLFLKVVQTARVMDFHLDGAELLRNSGPGLVIANHPTLLDVVMIISYLPQADCIVKEALWHNFFLRRIIASAGYIPNNDGPEVAQEAIDRVRKGRRVVIFPEGTRSLPNALRSFNKGFAHIAVRSPCPIWPVVMKCQPSALTKGRSVFSVPKKRARLSARAGPPLNPVAYYDPADSVSLAVIKVTAAVKHYFEERVDYSEFGQA